MRDDRLFTTVENALLDGRRQFRDLDKQFNTIISTVNEILTKDLEMINLYSTY